MSFGNVRAYWQVLTLAAREDRANPARLLGSVALGIARLVLIAAIYRVAYELTGSHKLPYENAVWSMGLYFAVVMGLSVRNVFKLVEHDVKTGAVEATLLRPLDWRMVKICQQIGKNLLETTLLVVAFMITLLVVVGVPETAYFSPGFLAGYGLLLLLSVVCASCIFLMVGLAAFWLNDSASIYRIVDRSLMVFSGAFVPIALLPGVVQDVLRYSPVGVYGAATQLFNPGLSSFLLPTIISAIIWTGVLLFVGNWIWRRAERRIEVNGG